MAQPGWRPPRDPLVVIFGSTGTGKSDLAVDLATRFNGEIVNADAMQMYRGLPIITNKISLQEQRGVAHHLFDNIGVSEEPWFVHSFKQEASRIIQDIRNRGKLPIVVGGSHYYITGLLFEDQLVQEDASSVEPGEPDERLVEKHPILGASAEAMLAKLREVDPIMASRWHPNDARKIRRSLAIYLQTGKPASAHYAEQESRKDTRETGSRPAQSPWQAILLWVHADRKVLIERLDRRVDKMVMRGLLDEVQELHGYLRDQALMGNTVDRSKGIWQSIGFSQFEPYLEALAHAPDSPELDGLMRKGIDETQAATRRYAQYQIKWITKKLMPPIREAGLLDCLYLLDSTRIEHFQKEVLGTGADLVQKYLAGEPLPQAAEISQTAQKVLAATVAASDHKETIDKQVCQICNMTLMTKEGWERHVKGKTHRRVAKKRGKNMPPLAEQATEQVSTEQLDVEQPP